MEHPRPNHINMRANNHIVKIAGGKYGIIGLNNMIPVNTTELINFDINNDPNKYILKRQYTYCYQHWANIEKQAIQIYNKRVIKPNKFELKNFCNFKLLEQKCDEYIINQSLSNKIQLAKQKANQQNANRQKKPIQNKDKGQEK